MDHIIAVSVQLKETVYTHPGEWRMIGGREKGQRIMDICARNGVTPTRLIEVGAGDGAVLRHLGDSAFCPEMHALEISESGVDIINSQAIPGLISCQTFDGYSIPFPDNHFCVAVLTHVLEHVEFERVLLRELKRVSRFQVIEVPLDIGGLNEDYAVLGPSFGHINVYSPMLLRYLLCTEGYRVIDGSAVQYSMELAEYDYFVNGGRRSTEEDRERFRAKFLANRAAFEALPLQEQEKRALAYIALTTPEGPAERQARMLAALLRYAEAGHIAHASLVFGVIPDEQKIPVAMQVVSRAVDYGQTKMAQDFVRRVLQLDPGNEDAKALQSSLGS